MLVADVLHLYEYHFTLNRRIWERSITTLSADQFVQDHDYSQGSVRNQVVHMLSVDESWFNSLDGDDGRRFLDPATFPDRASVRAYWDNVETMMRRRLAGLSDERLRQDVAPGYAPGLKVWQALLQVLNHGTDHRAQLLALLHQLGAPTFAQDYIYFAMGRE